jgi:RNA polymerase sigma factor (sigma-70 family)
MATAPCFPVPATLPAVLNSGRRLAFGTGMAELTDPAERRRAALMVAAQEGDAESYAALLREAVPLIAAAARKRGIAPDAVDDVVQDVLLTIHRVRQTYDPSRSFGAWLHAIADRRAIDHLRRRGRRQTRELHAPEPYLSHPDPAESAEGRVVLGERARLLGEAVRQLPPGQREAVERLAIRDQSLAEAAAETGRSKVALKVNLHRALKTLRARMAGEG